MRLRPGSTSLGPGLGGWGGRPVSQGKTTVAKKSFWPLSHAPYRPYGMALKNIIGWQIRRIRIQKGMTVHHLSSALPNSSPPSSEELAQIELGTRKIYDHELLAISQVFGVSIEDRYATPPRKTLPEDLEAWKILAQLEDIISVKGSPIRGSGQTQKVPLSRFI